MSIFSAPEKKWDSDCTKGMILTWILTLGLVLAGYSCFKGCSHSTDQEYNQAAKGVMLQLEDGIIKEHK